MFFSFKRRLSSAALTPVWPKYRRIIAYAWFAVGLLLTIHAAHSYGTMAGTHRQLARMEQPAQHPPSSAPASHCLTQVSIPKIKLDVMLVEATSRSSLLSGPGHLDDTPSPGAEESTINTHRETVLRHLGDLGRGDDIYVRRAGHAYHYIVKRKAIVQANDGAVVKPSLKNQLTLITRYPAHQAGPAPQRLVVIAERINDAVRSEN